MPIHQVVFTTPNLDKKIYDLAAAIKGRYRGHIVTSPDGGETYLWDKSDEFYALGREYLKQKEIFQQRVSGVTLEAIEESPILFCIRKGCINLPSNNVGVVIPLRNPENMFSLEEDNIDVKSGDYHKNAKLIPAHVPIYMILHPKLPLTAPEVLAT